MELVLTGRRFDAHEAEGLGFVNEVAGKREWLEQALELAQRIARRPPIAARLAKQAVLAAEETGAQRRARARAPPLRAGDGDRGPGRGHAGLPREAPARLQGPLA